MASSFVRREVVPGVPTRITLPSSEVVCYMHLDGKTKQIVLRLGQNGGGTVQIENDDGSPLSFAIAAGEAGVHMNPDGKWYAYLTEDEFDKEETTHAQL